MLYIASLYSYAVLSVASLRLTNLAPLSFVAKR